MISPLAAPRIFVRTDRRVERFGRAEAGRVGDRQVFRRRILVGDGKSDGCLDPRGVQARLRGCPALPVEALGVIWRSRPGRWRSQA